MSCFLASQSYSMTKLAMALRLIAQVYPRNFGHPSCSWMSSTIYSTLSEYRMTLTFSDSLGEVCRTGNSHSNGASQLNCCNCRNVGCTIRCHPYAKGSEASNHFQLSCLRAANGKGDRSLAEQIPS